MITLQTFKISSKQGKVRKLILSNNLRNHESKFSAMAKETGTSLTTAKRIVLRHQKALFNICKKDLGRKAGTDKKLVKVVKNLFGRNQTLSVRDVSVKTKTTKFTVTQTKQKSNLKTYRVQKVPDRSNENQLVAEKRARKVYMEYPPKFDCCVMDDETCVKPNFRQV